MNLSRPSRLIVRLAPISTALLIVAGCSAPWFGRGNATPTGSPRHSSEAHEPSISAAEANQAEQFATEAHSAANSAANDATLAAVMQEVQAIGETNPAAQKILLDELGRSTPEMWPLVLQHFRSTLAFHEQLKSAEPSTPIESAASHEIHQPEQHVAALDPPSSKVGALGDPRGVQPSAAVEQALATATPANMPAPSDGDATEWPAGEQYVPQQFAGDAAARPLAALNHRGDLAIVDDDKQRPASVELAAFSRTGAPTIDDSSLKSNATGEQVAQHWQQQLRLAIADLNRRAADAPQTTAEVHQQISLRLLELLAGDTEAALRPIPNISAEEQDFWSGQIFALATLLDHHSQPDDKRRAAASVTHLDEAVGHLREMGSLSLRNLAFCKNVYDYGAYEPFDDPSFVAGKQVSLYVEVENYHSESTDEGYSTSLGTSYEIVDEDGDRIDGGAFPDVDDCCQSRRRDFHIQYGLVLPNTMSTGKYRLQLVMKDRQSDKIGQASIAFEIRGTGLQN